LLAGGALLAVLLVAAFFLLRLLEVEADDVETDVAAELLKDPAPSADFACSFACCLAPALVLGLEVLAEEEDDDGVLPL